MAFLRERLQPVGWIGIAVSCAGAMLIAVGKDGHLQLSTGALFVLLAAFFAAIWAVVQRPVTQRVGATRVTTYAICFGTLLLTPWIGSLIGQVRAAPLHATLGIVYLGIFPAAIANTLWAYALIHVPASRLAVLVYLMPPMTILLTWVTLHEAPTTPAMIGGAIAILGVVIVNRSKGSTAPKVAMRAVPPPAANAGD